MELKDVLNRLSATPYGYARVRRQTPPDHLNTEEALQVVQAIGQKRNPSFVIDEGNRFAYENLIRWVHADPDFRCLDPQTKEVRRGRLDCGIFLAGGTGRGKSWALDIIGTYADLVGAGITINDRNEGFALRWRGIRADEICDHFQAKGDISNYKQRYLLAIQDLGAEAAESLYMGNRVGVIRTLLEARGDDAGTLTLITSNYSLQRSRKGDGSFLNEGELLGEQQMGRKLLGGDKLVLRYGERVFSRLRQMCNYLEIKGGDRRLA